MSGRRGLVALLLGAVLVLGVAPPPAASAAPTSERGTYDGPEGSRERVVVTPAAGAADAPVLVALHGCSQDADDVIAGWQLEELAERSGALVVAPEQPSSANTLSCWNWFLPEHQSRGTGEPALLTALVAEVVSEHGADPDRVTVAGLSAGGAMAIVLGVTYPEMFAAVGSVAGCPYRGLPCLGAPSLVPDAVAGRAAFDAMGERARAVPLFVLQGDADTTVPPENADRVTGQWLALADLADDGEANGSVSVDPVRSERAEATEVEHAAIVRTYDLGGCARLERWDVEGLEHAWPGGDAEQGSYVDPLGPSATELLWRFATASQERCAATGDGATPPPGSGAPPDPTDPSEPSEPSDLTDPSEPTDPGGTPEPVGAPSAPGPAPADGAAGDRPAAPATRSLPATGAGAPLLLGAALLLTATRIRRRRTDDDLA